MRGWRDALTPWLAPACARPDDPDAAGEVLRHLHAGPGVHRGWLPVKRQRGVVPFPFTGAL